MVRPLRWSGVLLLAVALITATGAARSAEGERSVAGTWSVTVKGHGAHGDMEAEMTLAQDGHAVTGRLSAHGRAHDVEGEFSGETLKLSSTASDTHPRMTLTATLEEDGELTGQLSGPDGDLPLTAKRVKAKY